MGIWDNFFEKARGLFGNEEGSSSVPKKRCYYELLEVDKTATEDEIKRSYKKMALKWHPDKNPDRLEECTAYFVILQQAYEVLCDPHERAFYDKHRENIIHGGDGTEEVKDTGIKLDKYFERGCFQGFGDAENGFYTIYRELFHKVAAEEYSYIDDLDERNFPVFGRLTSDYDNIVDPFYAFWMDFSTRRSFAWVDKWDMRQAQDRQTARLMEKDNKKLREAAKKLRSEEIQKLVIHIRKLDKRVKQNRARLEQKRKDQLEKVAEQQKQAIRRNLENIGEYEVSEEILLEQQKNLEDIENELDAEFGTMKENIDDESQNDSDEENMFCIVCDKSFKTPMAYTNHQRSRKHKQMVESLKVHMKEEDQLLFCEEGDDLEEDDFQALLHPQAVSKKKKKKKVVAVEEEPECPVETLPADQLADSLAEATIHVGDAQNTGVKPKAKARRRNQTKAGANSEEHIVKSESSAVDKAAVQNTAPVESACQNCHKVFESRTKLFTHLRETGHATLKNAVEVGESTKKGGKKGKSKK